MSFYTQASIDMVRDEELLGLLQDANFVSVFIGIESPRKSSLAETHKTQNEKLDMVEATTPHCKYSTTSSPWNPPPVDRPGCRWSWLTAAGWARVRPGGGSSGGRRLRAWPSFFQSSLLMT
jgi:hypothetical protein